ncbi:YjeF-related protein N-terminus family protein [Candida parapsilosis]|uniref:Enhancer of mRNA-decapping protein 3 n=2 Tax=Candida parapsilosis TaxID=5480 RepID=G8BH75_CANPC|nr:uncharacterized protein CPAR2_500250 [Candida parapsilosis]KAF6044408.1 YjeF-related protein N-terminus family protein [Candida parapsilosis]KAF6045207.1 YjeF-related protein N-terminus family protein [Candida parapsilosis]KAF6048648.1 YjeF-related protein N-terminus family protein [Candida parapsilosis]KAF6060649.1 YjeF-related protein N-terminus family protein [Candida parapsilosis]KAI5901073.1 Enhancer of mRNA-decapping protein 3 [Candida parapsilosis]
MTEFVQYEVVITLKDNSTARGTISYVDEKSITLSNALTSTDRKIQPSVEFLNTDIADLKVSQLPPYRPKSNDQQKKSKKQKNEDIVDDAIVYSSKPSRSNTPKPEKSKSKSKSRTESSDLEPESIENVKNEEFDFEANLAMFDKKAVFEDFKKNDHTSISDRLVGHNKVEKPAKQKKQKYDNDEMVLQDVARDNWDQIGKSQENSRTNTPKSDGVKTQGRAQQNPTEARNRNFKLINSENASPIQSASPVQLLEIERLSSDNFGVTPAMMAEICATNLSKLIIDRCLGGSVRLSNKKNHNLPPLVLLLVGSGRCGSRAFATGRHLSNHGVRVLAFVISSDESDTELHHQWKIFESVGGKVVTSSFDLLIDIIRNQLNTPVELIVDALQGYDDHLEDIFYEPQDKKTLTSLINWCNSSEQSKVMSLDIPSGIDGGSGIPDDELKVDCSWCISMGLPLNGLLLAYKNNYLSDDDIVHYLIDVGIPNKVFQTKQNLRKFDNFWYTAESSIKLDVEA